jgi:2-polyprenyl-3-methyl-5-hydroxy-6-metoxy-1,4-benzoquinol methylase
MMLETIDTCQLCGCKRFLGLTGIRIPKDERKASLGIAEDATSWYMCQECTFMFQNPRLERNYMKDWYARSGFHMDDMEISQGQIGHTTIQLARFEAFLYFNGIRIADLTGATCMDYGCGIGAALNVLAEKGNEVWGVELDKREVEFGKRHYPKMKFVHNLEDIPADRRFNFMFTHHAMEHVFDPNEFVSYISRVLRPEGVAMVIVPAWRYANTLNAINGFALSDNSMFDHVSLSGFFNKHGMYVFSYLYQNNEDWELCVLAKKSPKKNHFTVAPNECLAELYQNIAIRHAERVAEGGRAPDPVVVRM